MRIISPLPMDKVDLIRSQVGVDWSKEIVEGATFEDLELLSTGNIPRGVFCEQSSQKTRELRREIMQSMISVHREACYWARSEQ